ncbi:transcription antitermination factor NusB [Telmatospirillum siberiense]|uniref:transcription antitermination factor NusB n=1 Tax=Telmatospirillum siberiense TaxID=382514 RepID=UPI003B839C44
MQARSAARLAAVQALYNAELSGQTPDLVLDDFLKHGIGGKVMLTPEGVDPAGFGEVEHVLADPDPLMLTAIFRGTLARRDDFDEMIAGALSADWTVDRLETVLRAILRAGACELADFPDVPVRVVISEYVDIAHAFYSGPEPGLVNAVLDRIGRVVRAGEIGGDVRSR